MEETWHMCKSAVGRPLSQTEWPYKKEINGGGHQDSSDCTEGVKSFSSWDGSGSAYSDKLSGRVAKRKPLLKQAQ